MARHATKRGCNKRSSLHKRLKPTRKSQEPNRKVRKDARDQKKMNKRHSTGKVSSNPFEEEMQDVSEICKKSEKSTAELRKQAKNKRKSEHEKQVAEKRKVLFQENKKRIAIVSREVKAENQELHSDSDNEEPSKARLNAALRTFSRELKHVITESDVVLEILDARDPLGTRSREAEKRVFESGAAKRVVLVLNKVDLVPAQVTRSWLAYLRQELPTVAFKANTQTQRGKLGRSNKFRSLLSKRPDFGLGGGADEQNQTEDRINTRQCVGAESLLQLLKNYARSRGSSAAGGESQTKQTITVGVIGYPNVGKSSVVNSLRREKVCAVGAKPGVTRAVHEVQLDRNVRLLDSPGVVLDTTLRGDADAVLRNALEADSTEDPSYIVDAVAAKVGLQKLAEHYCLEQQQLLKNVTEFLVALARRSGKLKKGGIPDLDAAARRVIQDWQVGAIRYFSVPPSRHESVLDAKVVASFSSEFDAETVYAANEQEHLASDGMDTMDAQKSTPESSQVQATPVAQVQMLTQPPKVCVESRESCENSGLQLNRAAMKRQKKLAKKKRKHERRVDDLLSSVTGMQIEHEDEDNSDDISMADSDSDADSDF